jgi:hypothetical protein
MARLKKFLIALNLPLIVAKLIVLGRSVILAMTNNSWFPSPPIVLALFALRPRSSLLGTAVLTGVISLLVAAATLPAATLAPSATPTVRPSVSMCRSVQFFSSRRFRGHV